MSKGLYVIDQTFGRNATCGLMPGVHYFQTRLVRGGPLVTVKTAVIEHKDEAGELAADTEYRVWINGQELPWERWREMTLIAECEISAERYDYLIKALDWDRKHAGVEVDRPVDIATLPPVMPLRRGTKIEMPSAPVFVTADGVYVDDIEVTE